MIKSTLCRKCPYSELFWFAFSSIRIEYRQIRSISPYSFQMRENTDQNDSKYGYFQCLPFFLLQMLTIMEPFPYDYGKQLFLENAVKLHLLNLHKHSKIFRILAKYSGILASKLCEYINPDVFANTTIGTARILQISKMDSFATTFNGFSPLNIVSNLFI